MDWLGVYFNNLTDTIKTAQGSSINVVRLFNHLFLVWGPPVLHYLTDVELRRLHRRFGHPSVDRLVRTLKRAGHDDHKHRKILEQISQVCQYCQKYGRSPGRFKFTLRDDVYFNYSLVVDIMYIDGPILHVVDQAIAFQAARWLQNISAKHVWETLRLCWIDVYTGPPDVIVHDAGTNFDSAEFRRETGAMAIRTKCIPVEAP